MDSKSFYAYVRDKSKTKVRVGPLIDDHGHVVSENRGMARILNKYFATVFTQEDLSKLPIASSESMGSKAVTFSTVEVTERKIIEVVLSLKDNKAAGVDGINSTFLKRCVHSLATPLRILFTESLSSGRVPKDWKMVNVTAIFKKGTKKEPENYRPVSLTSQICKI